MLTPFCPSPILVDYYYYYHYYYILLPLVLTPFVPLRGPRGVVLRPARVAEGDLPVAGSRKLCGCFESRLACNLLG